MRIAQAAQLLGVSISTLKRLEKRGLILVRKDRNGQRRYTDHDIAAIRALYYPPAPAATATAPDAADRPA
jgi:DNA-binding transcriptional MerR regulator